MSLELYCQNTDIWNSTQSSTTSDHGLYCLTLIRIRNILFLTCSRVQKLQYEPAHDIMVLNTYATSEGSGEPAHPKGWTKNQSSSPTGWLRMRV